VRKIFFENLECRTEVCEEVKMIYSVMVISCGVLFIALLYFLHEQIISLNEYEKIYSINPRTKRYD
jgi:hypothetical protein